MHTRAHTALTISLITDISGSVIRLISRILQRCAFFYVSVHTNTRLKLNRSTTGVTVITTRVRGHFTIGPTPRVKHGNRYNCEPREEVTIERNHTLTLFSYPKLQCTYHFEIKKKKFWTDFTFTTDNALREYKRKPVLRLLTRYCPNLSTRRRRTSTFSRFFFFASKCLRHTLVNYCFRSHFSFPQTWHATQFHRAPRPR